MLSKFKKALTELSQVPDLIEKAKDAMGVTGDGSAFSDDVLRIEVSGPDRPHLTIVDLPGLIHSENKLQSENDVELVRKMVQAYMANKRSIILAIISAKNDYANQIILKLAKKVDFSGQRTLGIITKPDTLSAGSESEAAFINLAENKDVEFRLGWHLIRNRDYEMRDASSLDRDRKEKEFFSEGAWKNVPSRMKGVATLRTRLSRVLLDQIKKELPAMVKDIETSTAECRLSLLKLGPKRTTTDEQRSYLFEVSQSFQSILKAAVDGTYGNAFFGDASTEEGYSRRLRAVIQNMNEDFAEAIETDGQSPKILDYEEVDSLEDRSDAPDAPEAANRSAQDLCESGMHRLEKPRHILREDYIDEIEPLLRRSRGRELPGMFNPLMVSDLFQQLSAPWKDLATRHLKQMEEAVQTFLKCAIEHATDEVTSSALLCEIINPMMDKKVKDVAEKLADLVQPYRESHPITYNHYFTETIQKARQQHAQEDMMSRFKDFIGVDDDDSLGCTFEHLKIKGTNLQDMISSLTQKTEDDMNRYACNEILLCVEAYYKVTTPSITSGQPPHES